MNGTSNGILPTVELATTNGNNGYAYPVMYGNGFGNSGFFGGDGIWALVLLALLFGNMVGVDLVVTMVITTLQLLIIFLVNSLKEM